MIESADDALSGPYVTQYGGLLTPPETTGRFVVVFAESTGTPTDVLSDVAGIYEVASSHELAGDEAAVSSTDTVFEELGIAVVSADPEQIGALQVTAESDGQVVSVSPELVHHVLDGSYARGFADGAADLAARLGALQESAGTAAPTAPGGSVFADSATHTWGIQAVGAAASSCSGKGISVAVLDTGFDSSHPDFAGRGVTTRSFITNESAQDTHGHGTHCIGTALGPKSPTTGPRYGVAHGADVFAGKVLSNSGSGSDSGILAGISWAIRSGCSIISMSLGANVPRVHPPYVAAGKRALDQSVLIIAAAGNNADRARSAFGFVGTPANSPYIMSVGALTQRLGVANFSARSLAGTQGGQVDVAAPGVAVYSSWPMPTRYRSIQGTSMATPHVAGVAALCAEATGFRGRALWATLVEQSQRLIAPSVDVGSGLVVCP